MCRDAHSHSLDWHTGFSKRELQAAAKIDYVKNVAVAKEEANGNGSTWKMQGEREKNPLLHVPSYLAFSIAIFFLVHSHLLSCDNFCKQFACTLNSETLHWRCVFFFLFLLLHMATTELWIKQPKLSAVLFQKFMSVQFPRLIWFLFLLLIVISFPSCWQYLKFIAFRVKRATKQRKSNENKKCDDLICAMIMWCQCVACVVSFRSQNATRLMNGTLF